MRAPRAAAAPLLLITLAILVSSRAAVAAEEAADTSSAAFAATSTAPWNPPRAIPASDPWEAVLRFPGRVASLPLAALGQGTRRTLLAAEQGFYVQRFFRGVKMPFSIGPAGLGDRTGLGFGVGIAPEFGPVHFDGLFDASLKQYTRGRARLTAHGAFAEYRADRRPAERFFGYGMDAREDNDSRYGLVQQRAIGGLETTLPMPVLGENRRVAVSAWAGPRWSRVTQGHEADEPSIAVTFPAAVAGSLDREFEHFTYGARVEVNAREGRPHWTHGGRANFEAERYDVPLVSSPSRTGAQFTRYSMLAEAGFSFMRDPRTLRLTFAAVDNEPGAGSGSFLVSDLARLGGVNGLAGFEPHRFHSLDAMNLRAAYVFPLAQNFEFDLHGDAGGVFADLQNDARPNLLRQSIGFGLRGRTVKSVVATIGFDISPEAARFVFSLGPER